jgi:hypothetical protein
MQNEKAPCAARVTAATAILDRGYGKTPQAYVDNDGDSVSLEELIHMSYRVGKKSSDVRDAA